MPDIAYTDYPMILNTDSMEWVLVGYLIHVLLSVFQGVLAGVLMVSGAANLFTKGAPPLKKLLRFFGGGIDFPIASNQRMGFIQLALGIALVLPFLLNISYLVSLLAALIAVIYLAGFEYRLMQRPNLAAKFFALSYIVFAVLISGFSLYEGHDNLKFGIETAFKAKKHRDAEIAWQLSSDPHSPKVGDMAPNFTLTSIDGESELQLKSLLNQGKPVVLFFGANSCPAFSQGTLGINRLHEKYQSKVNFVGVYVKEPHPSDEWWLTPSRFMSQLHARVESRAAVDIKQPSTFTERLRVARRAHQNLLNTGIPFMVDTPDNAVNNRWTGQPTRIYLLSENGEIIYNPGTGPYAFNPDYLEPVLDEYLAGE